MKGIFKIEKEKTIILTLDCLIFKLPRSILIWSHDDFHLNVKGKGRVWATYLQRHLHFPVKACVPLRQCQCTGKKMQTGRPTGLMSVLCLVFLKKISSTTSQVSYLGFRFSPFPWEAPISRLSLMDQVHITIHIARV